ncbi:MAG: KTSC domain-containing protein [Pseudomonadota bacterium]|nr:KTSC domain-containing protein [Pseudomonadota bacterium]
MPSTVIRHFEHDPATRQLTVTFTTGRIYVYDDVPDAVAAALRAAPSKGAFFNSQIRNVYPYRELPSPAP